MQTVSVVKTTATTKYKCTGNDTHTNRQIQENVKEFMEKTTFLYWEKWGQG